MVMEIITSRIELFSQQTKPEKKFKKKKPQHNNDEKQEEQKETTLKHTEDFVEISDEAYDAQELSTMDNT